MTLTTLIVVNAMLAAAVVLGMVWLLGSAIRSDRRSVVAAGASLRAAPERRTSDSLAA
jgi:hypothetical protein